MISEQSSRSGRRSGGQQSLHAHLRQFLDFVLFLEDHNICWECKPRKRKAPLRYDAALSNLRKGAALLPPMRLFSLVTAVKKSHLQTADASFRDQAFRLRRASYPSADYSCSGESRVAKERVCRAATPARFRKRISCWRYKSEVTVKSMRGNGR